MINIKYIVLDASSGEITGNGIVEKDYTLQIAKYMYDKLKEKGINVFLAGDSDTSLTISERVELIKNKFGTSSDVIVISNRLNENNLVGINIIYGLRNSSNLSDKIVSNLINNGFEMVENYQRRDEINTNQDYDEIIRDTANNETIIISYGNVNDIKDVENLKNNWQVMADAVVDGLLEYIGVNGITNYVVISGDSLYSIAKRYNTTVDSLKNLNNLTTNNLSIGQILKVPINNNSNNTNYVVISGDSLYSIAKRYNTTIEELKSLNNLTTNNLNIGQLLKIPSK